MDHDVDVEDVIADEAGTTLRQETNEASDATQNIFSQDERFTADIAAKKIAATSTEAIPQEPELEYATPQDVLDDAEMEGNRCDHGYGNQEDDTLATDLSPQLHRIEVVLRPPNDPNSYDRIPRSKTVLRVLAEIERGDETFYEVEFIDGRIKHVSVDLYTIDCSF
jgi:hypothetical protein